MVHTLTIWSSATSTSTAARQDLGCTGVPRSQATAPPPKGHHRALGTVLLQSPRGVLFLMSEVPL